MACWSPIVTALLFSVYIFPFATCDVTVACAPALTAQRWSTLYGAGTVGPITLPAGSTVLLDVSLVTINGGLTIPAGSSLYFDWQRSITVVTPNIIVKGSLWIGSEACPFENKVNITLINDLAAADITVDLANVGR